MYVLLGSHGQITSRLARLLRAAGHPVRVVGRDAHALAPLADAGCELALGDAADADFLARAFAGASAAYTMIPPCYGEDDMRGAQDRIGAAIARALARSGIARVVNLSSMGAELPTGTGPIEALHAQEQRLASIAGAGLLHLRPGFFMDNFLPAAFAVAQTGVLAGMEAPDAPIPMVATRDIAAVAARELVTPQHQGTLLLYAAGTLTMRQAAIALGTAVGQPGLAYVQSTPEQAKAELREHGFSASAADQLELLARWLSSAPLESASAGPVALQPTSLEVFAREEFAPAYARAKALAG